MSDGPDLNTLFSLNSPLPPPSINPAPSASGLEFLSQLHQRKSETLKALLLQHSWQEITGIDANAASAVFIIAHHADYDPDFQRYCHAIMLATAKNGTLPLGFLAFMTDRILTNQGLHQRFGTQIREVANGCFVPKPLENPDQVDELRAHAQMGENLSDYLQRINDGDELPYRPLLPDYAQKLEYIREHKVIPFPGTAH